jgi:hypothetical protein
MTVAVADDADALLALEPEDGPNADYTVVNENNTLGIDISDSNPTGPAGSGVNKDAYTVIRNIFKVTNQGTQEVYVWAEGLPEEIRMFHDDPDGATNDVGNSGYSINNGGNDGAFSTSSSIYPEDPTGQVEHGGEGGDEAAPLLTPGETLENIGLLVDIGTDFSNFNQNITVKAVAPSEL